MKRACVTGAGGFLGHNLTKYLVQRGYWVRGVDIKPPEFEYSAANEFVIADLRESSNCLKAALAMDEVFHLACDIGGIGYITKYHADVATNTSLIDINMLKASVNADVQKFFWSSSACIYPIYKQGESEVVALKESDAWPADPERGYGLAKLYTEELCRYFKQEKHLDTRIARFHNIYGPVGTFDGGKEKAPAALCRKIAMAVDGDFVEIWGDGKATRSFCYVGDCVEGVYRLMESDYSEPLNIGSDRLVTILELAEIIREISGKDIRFRFNPKAPQGVRGRNSDNTLIQKVLGWAPGTSLEDGLRVTYKWVEEQVRRKMC